MPGKGQVENPSRKQLCVSTYVARSSLLLILGQLKLTLAPRAGTWPLGQQVPFPSAAEAPTHAWGDGGGMTRKGWRVGHTYKMMQAGWDGGWGTGGMGCRRERSQVGWDMG